MELWEERREFFRVDGQVLLYYRKITEAERETLLASGGAKESNLTEALADNGLGADVTDDPQRPRTETELEELRGRLQRIERKLDLLLQGLSGGQSKQEDLPFKPCFVNISGCGMRFPTMERFDVGDCLEVMVLLPVMPGHPIHILGEVVHILDREETACELLKDYPFDTAVKFISLLEEDRERIVRYTFSQQARMLREQRADARPQAAL